MSTVFVSEYKYLLDFDWVFAQLRNTYWGQNLDPMRLKEAIEKSICFGLYMADAEGRHQIGFARVVTDFATFSSLMDVIVEEKHRRKGYGTILMKAVLGHRAVTNTMNVISSRHAVEFYRKFGYKVLDDKVMTLSPCR